MTESEIRALTERAERAERERDEARAEVQRYAGPATGDEPVCERDALLAQYEEWRGAAQEVIDLFDPAHARASPALLTTVARAAKEANASIRAERDAAEAALSRAREALESWERDVTIPAVHGIAAVRAALAAPDPGAPPRCARCGDEYRSLTNPRWRGYPWKCGKCGCVNPGTLAAGPGAEAMSGDDLCGSAWCGKPDGHKGACDTAILDWWTKREEIEAALREAAAVLGALRYREDHAQWALPHEVILAGICPEPGQLREKIRAALAAFPDPSPVAGPLRSKVATDPASGRPPGPPSPPGPYCACGAVSMWRDRAPAFDPLTKITHTLERCCRAPEPAKEEKKLTSEDRTDGGPSSEPHRTD